MKIAIFPQGCIPIHANSIKERPLGGIETGIIRLAEVLYLRGHQVQVYSSYENPPESLPPYLNLRNIQSLEPVDLFIAVREWFPLMSDFPTKVKLFWTGDGPEQLQNYGLGDKRVFEKIDGFMAVSHWQAHEFSKQSGFPEEKIFVINNGIHLPYFESTEHRFTNRLIYSATPFRGLIHLPAIFKALKQNFPDLELHIFSGLDVYFSEKQSPYLDKITFNFGPVFEELDQIEGVFLRGNVIQEQIAQELKRSYIYCYPNTFPETSCISLMEAQAAGCVPVTSLLAALPETLGNCGILIEGKAGSEEYLRRFIEATKILLNDSSRWTSLSRSGIEKAKTEFSWLKVAERLEREVFQRFNLL